MPSSIRVDAGFRSNRDQMRGAVDRALPHRQSYLGFALGLVATVVVALAAICWWLVQSGVVYIRINV